MTDPSSVLPGSCRLPGVRSGLVMQIGSRVKIHRDGVSVFVVKAIDDEGHVRVESLADAPGRYQFSLPAASVVLCSDSEAAPAGS